jgi:hypothetical protein
MAIDPDLYLNLSNSYGAAFRAIKNAALYIDEINLIIIQMSNVEAKLDLMRNIKNTNLNIKQSNQSENLLPAVRNLNERAIMLSGYDNINDYLLYNNILVSQEWADLCSQTGVEINSSNIVTE